MAQLEALLVPFPELELLNGSRMGRFWKVYKVVLRNSLKPLYY